MRDLVVVGAGLAGLACANSAQRAGLDVEVWEAAEVVGGRVATQVVDGFRCDRGFQLINPAYPALRRVVDMADLHLERFGRGVAVRRDQDLAVLSLPPRPRALARAMRGGLATRRGVTGLMRWTAPALVPPSRWLDDPDRTLREELDAVGFHGPLRSEVVEPFLTGVVLGDPGASSALFIRLLVRSFLRATPGVPAQGMAALPHQMARGWRDKDLRLGWAADAIERAGAGWRVHGPGGTVEARAVVVAADPIAAARLTGIPARRMTGCVTDWFACDAPPSAEPLLHVDGRVGRGPVVNTAVMTNVAPSYAPPGRHLVQATCLRAPAAVPVAVEVVLRHVAEIYGCPTTGWQHVTRNDVPHALPLQPPPLVARAVVDLGDGMFVCGDHRDTASLQGALVSGIRTAAEVRDHLRPSSS